MEDTQRQEEDLASLLAVLVALTSRPSARTGTVLPLLFPLSLSLSLEATHKDGNALPLFLFVPFMYSPRRFYLATR